MDFCKMELYIALVRVVNNRGCSFGKICSASSFLVDRRQNYDLNGLSRIFQLKCNSLSLVIGSFALWSQLVVILIEQCYLYSVPSRNYGMICSGSQLIVA